LDAYKASETRYARLLHFLQFAVPAFYTFRGECDSMLSRGSQSGELSNETVRLCFGVISGADGFCRVDAGYTG
jgi:hypothetical protein